ncbi:MAG TPA: glucose-6-phosphate isomerase [Candidatus Limisoma intestinavium]|uniref:Glucose-6-phosphate isomerase n=1 Tax=Candidatus Limisoma intestinavium TaxID=2840856 RepID=A0A9D1LHM1_9BACT|nr:glucose-6-phosphate isomerase [Candidatus Limisoma intestinavium]
MENLKLSIKHVLGFVDKARIDALDPIASDAVGKLENGTGEGCDYLGWLHLAENMEGQVAEICRVAEVLRRDCEYVVAIGIGGSYLGAKAVISALSDSFADMKPSSGARVLFAGHNIGEDYMGELMELLSGKKFGIIVVSKSGTTTEPAIAFRLLKEMLEKQEGKAFAAKHIVAVTDAQKGALRKLANDEGYETFTIAGNVGGRFSVLTPVGLLPIAVAGFDIRRLLDGAAAMEKATAAANDSNPAYLYAKTRNALYREGKKIEILVNYNPKLHYFGEWWKQLYGESEGKDHKGIFPAAVDNSTDLHSMGQWIQQGERTIFETVVSVSKTCREVVIPFDSDNLDGLNYIAGKRVDEVNKMAELGTLMAHVDGGVPNIHITIPELSEYTIGGLIYFFEKSCGISGYILGVNPFNQPGVEAYKRNMFALLDKPGYEEESKAIREKLG